MYQSTISLKRRESKENLGFTCSFECSELVSISKFVTRLDEIEDKCNKVTSYRKENMKDIIVKIFANQVS